MTALLLTLCGFVLGAVVAAKRSKSKAAAAAKDLTKAQVVQHIPGCRGMSARELKRGAKQVRRGLRTFEQLFCPFCAQRIALNTINISPFMAQVLVAIVQRFRVTRKPVTTGWIKNNRKDIIFPSGDNTKIRYFGVAYPEHPGDGKKRCSGGWTPTELGIKWLLGLVKIPGTALTFNNNAIVRFGPPVSCKDVLKKRVAGARDEKDRVHWQAAYDGFKTFREEAKKQGRDVLIKEFKYLHTTGQTPQHVAVPPVVVGWEKEYGKDPARKYTRHV